MDIAALQSEEQCKKWKKQRAIHLHDLPPLGSPPSFLRHKSKQGQQSELKSVSQWTVDTGLQLRVFSHFKPNQPQHDRAAATLGTQQPGCSEDAKIKKSVCCCSPKPFANSPLLRVSCSIKSNPFFTVIETGANGINCVEPIHRLQLRLQLCHL